MLTACGVGEPPFSENESNQTEKTESDTTTDAEPTISDNFDFYPSFLKELNPAIVEWGEVTEEHYSLESFSDFKLPSGEKTETGFTKVEVKSICFYPFCTQDVALKMEDLNKTDAIAVPNYYLDQISEGGRALVLFLYGDFLGEVSPTMLVLPAMGYVAEGVSYHYPNFYSISNEGKIHVPTFSDEVKKELGAPYYLPFDEANDWLGNDIQFKDGMTVQEFEAFLDALADHIQNMESK